MALADITLADGQGSPVDHVFTYTSTVNNRVIRSNLAADPEEPELLTLAHSDTKIAGAPSKSHLWRLDRAVLDSDGITIHRPNVRVMCDVPNAVLADALADDFSAFVRNAITQAFFRVFLRGSVG